jgi:quinol monooxygenase YgiN
MENGGLDNHVTIVPYFKVPEARMDEFKSGFNTFYEGTKAGTEECLYYGFAVCGNNVFCREGYKSAEGVLAHLSDVKAPLDTALSIVGEGGLELAVMGPAAELEKLKGPLGPLGTKFWEIDGSSFWMNAIPRTTPPDTHVTIVPYFTVPEGKMSEFQKGFNKFYENTKAGTNECLYYGFAVKDNQVFCREGYKSAEGVLKHLSDVKAPLDAALAIVGERGLDLSVMGPAAELEKLREVLGPLGTKFWELDTGSFWMNPDASLVGPDEHVSIVPYFTVPEGKMDDFKKGFNVFYQNSKAGTQDCLYYGFAICGNKVFCREGYKTAAGVLAHLSDVKAPLDAALALTGAGGLDLAVMGPAAELEKLKGPLGPLGTQFFEIDAGSFWGAGMAEGKM